MATEVEFHGVFAFLIESCKEVGGGNVAWLIATNLVSEDFFALIGKPMLSN